MTENEFLLQDRLAKIKSINKQYDLEHNAYLSFSGGKDSTVLHYLLDEALPGNNIPRVFFNTGIEYKEILKFVREMASKDNRFVIFNVGKNIRDTLESVGYPFKSKEHSQKLYEWKRGCRSNSHLRYFRQAPDAYQLCPKQLMYQIEDDFNLKISHLCCYEFKKKPSKQYMKESGRKVTLTGMTRAEGGQRTTLNCVVFEKASGKLKKFHPLAVVDSSFEDWYIKLKSIKLSLNIKAVGAANASCPIKVVRRVIKRTQLDTLAQVAPTERKRAELIWKPVYTEMRRIGYRLRKEEPSLFEEL